MNESQPLEDKHLEATNMQKSLWKDRAFWVALLAFLHLLAILILQMLGLAKARQGSNAPEPLVSWCSPIFSPFGEAVLDGNCNVYPIVQTFKKGVGCIMISGSQQMSWLKATVAGTGLSLALETFDICILALVHSTTRWRGVKMRRPWFTMFTGIAVLALILVFGVVYSSNLPPGISERVWIVTNVGSPLVYAGKLGTAGLRGAIIGWNDGVFAEWASTYFGSWAAD